MSESDDLRTQNARLRALLDERGRELRRLERVQARLLNELCKTLVQHAEARGKQLSWGGAVKQVGEILRRAQRRADARRGEPIASYGRARALVDGVIRPEQVTSAPDYIPLFDAGQLAVTPGATILLERADVDVDALVNRHLVGDWGDISPEDRGLNEQALESGARILSVYRVGEEKVWIVTDAATNACPHCHDFYGGTQDPSCSVCHGSTWARTERRLTTTVLLPSEY